MGDLWSKLQTKIAGVPAWIWVAVVAGAVVGYAYLSRRAEDPAVNPAAFAYPDDEAPSDAGDVPGVPGDSGTDGREVSLTTNPAWIRYVTDRLVATGEYGAVEVTNALVKALGGLELTQQQAAIYNIAVSRYGAPPEGAPPITVTPTTPPPTTPPSTTPPKPAPPPTYYSVTVAKYTTKNPPWNSTLWGIAEHYGYGGSNWGTIWNDPKNKPLRDKRGSNTRIQPGDIVYVKKR